MKKATLLLSCICMMLGAKAQTFSDGFESYTAGIALGPQSPNWRTWSGAGGGADDVNVVTTDNHTSAGVNSIYFSSTSATGGPSDCVLPFNTTTAPLTTGQFTYTMWIKIPASKTAYFNFQGTATMGGMYTLDCWMDAAAGTITIQNTGTTVVTGTIPSDTWFEMKIDANLNTNNWNLMINGTSQGTWSNANDQVYAIDIYPADANASYWVDDVSYNVVPYTLPALNAAGNLITVGGGLVGESQSLAVKVRNLGTTTITSFNVAVSQNGGAAVTQSFSGSCASLATKTVTFPVPFTLAAGANVFTATVSSVNGGGADGDPSDDVITKTVNAITPAAGKMVVAEEGTGTWCQWCPRGAVNMDNMTTKHGSYFAGIAVHNSSSDPMQDAPYDAAIGPFIPGYPTVLVDRLTGVDPSAMENDFFTRVVIAPKAFLVNAETYNSTTGVLSVTVTTTVQQAFSGDYRLACVITEDSVTGSTSGYNQANAYAGGGSGVMGGFETLPNPVPASTMVYDHVARDIQPDFNGIPSAFGASTTVGQVFTNTFSFTLPSTWRTNKINIISLFIDPAGQIDNAAAIKIAEGATGVQELTAGASVNLFPNPTTDASTISVKLEKESTVQVSIYSVDGSLIAKKDYGKLSGEMMLPIETASINAGVYMVHVTINGQTTVKKLIKQ